MEQHPQIKKSMGSNHQVRIAILQFSLFQPGTVGQRLRVTAAKETGRRQRRQGGPRPAALSARGRTWPMSRRKRHALRKELGDDHFELCAGHGGVGTQVPRDLHAKDVTEDLLWLGLGGKVGTLFFHRLEQ